jgi:multicomponent Na+:H+ antiporter subunit D
MTTLAFIIGAAAIIGLPPLNGFASKWIIYESSAMYNPLLAAIAVVGTVFSLAAYTRVLFTFLGRESEKVKSAKEPEMSMLIPMLILVVAIVVMGLLPWQINDKIMLPTARMLEQLNGEYMVALLKFLGGA